LPGEICPVTASSTKEVDFYPTPEFSNVLQDLYALKKEVNRLRRNNSHRIAFNRVLKNVDSLEESIKNHFNELHALHRTLESTSVKGLTEKQRSMLQIISEAEETTIYTVLIDRLSQEMSVPRSTVRWNMKGLREAGLINAGDRETKGIPVSLTPTGRVVLGVLFPVN
jgi:DNA-binding MarR family transcriptional regulator